ncbi:dTDP-glucose 4,6-dehydratase [Polytolypa hystricis UAMH7299]|uniref:dTDP-glucose 4,6-dehydratase n=1 Tax=Polytolypa hystricis (strain UAMH7299) TaxID=1447883 RepID=A0A2B7Y103_POLH7|nr:dTDP-glucose 4,6-dehydratase [Polytolypa hystricis UAMH7299]
MPAEVYSAERNIDGCALIGSTEHQIDPTVRNILITGAAGFIGSWVTRHLTIVYSAAYNIVCYDKLDSCATLKNTACLNGHSNFRFVHGDITDRQAVVQCMREYDIDTVLHFAALSHVDASFRTPLEFTETNVKGTQIMLEAAVKSGVKKFIHISTDEVHGEVGCESLDLLEDSALAPSNPYAASKAAAEMYVHAYAKSYKLPCVIVRSNNVYGPHQYPEKLIPKFASRLDRGRPLTLHGDGKHRRRYLFAGDAVNAIDTVLHKGQPGETYNMGSVDEVSNLELARMMLEEFGIGEELAAKWIKHTKDRPFNDSRYAINSEKLQKLGWRPQVPFAQGLRMTIQWYRSVGRAWWGDVEEALGLIPEENGKTV